MDENLKEGKITNLKRVKLNQKKLWKKESTSED